MEVLVGPTFTMNVSSSPPSAYDGDHQKFAEGKESGHRIMERPKFSAGDSPESSSSIGTPDDSGDEEEEEEEVQSKLNRGLGLGSLDCLQDSLPIKRGLSGHFDGKSKSFTDLSQVSTVKELQKQENPFNKRRRVLMASKSSRRSAFYTWSNPKSMPLLPLGEDDDEEEEEKCRKLASPSSLSSSSSSSLTEEKKQEDQLLQLRRNRVPESYASKTRLRLGSFKSRSLSLADLQEHDDEDEDD